MVSHWSMGHPADMAVSYHCEHAPEGCMVGPTWRVWTLAAGTMAWKKAIMIATPSQPHTERLLSLTQMDLAVRPCL